VLAVLPRSLDNSTLPSSIHGVRVLAGADRLPGIPGDADDDEGDREPDQRVGDVQTDRDDERAQGDAEADEAVGAGVIAVRDERRAVQPAAGAQADVGVDLIADEPNRAPGCELTTSPGPLFLTVKRTSISPAAPPATLNGRLLAEARATPSLVTTVFSYA
jgi:hypothetical protein